VQVCKEKSRKKAEKNKNRQKWIEVTEMDRKKQEINSTHPVLLL
jgi:hypothetical protein